jgi:tetratricopeptide (TPR) repeat protein
MDDLVDALVPGMPDSARQLITGQAQGIPLFAVETIRSLIDRDVVIPRDGVYHLAGDIDTLTVPDGLHALLAARIDALDPDLRALVADAAVLGSAFPAEALVAVSGRDEAAVRDGLTELLRREVLEVSADKLSPERGSYRFAQNLLARVAYETLSRRDRKARHLAVATHLRSAFASDGEEVVDAIARHYRDALTAVPDDPDAEHIRSEAVSALVRGAQRALRSGAPRGASANYTAAAELIDTPGAAAPMWEAAAEADLLVGDWAAAMEHAERAAAGHAAAGRLREAARARAVHARALTFTGQRTDAHDRLTEVVQALRSEPDRDTVRALSYLSGSAFYGGLGDANALVSEALQLAQALDIDDGLLSHLFTIHGTFLLTVNRREEALASLEYATRVAERSAASAEAGLALLNVADALLLVDPPAAADAARAASVHLRRIGARAWLAGTVGNLSSALLLSGDWDGVAAVQTDAIDNDGLDDVEGFRATCAVLATLRGDLDSARQFAVTPGLRASEDDQDRAQCDALESLIAEAEGNSDAALAYARAALAMADSIGVRSEYIAQAWPVAVRAAQALGQEAVGDELFELLDAHPIGHLPTLLRAERDLARARRAGASNDAGAAEMFVAALAAERRFGSPYHLAQALLDQADYLAAAGDPDRAADNVAEARAIADRLGARPLASRADRVLRPVPTG